jgi:hypothetical protein
MTVRTGSSSHIDNGRQCDRSRRAGGIRILPRDAGAITMTAMLLFGLTLLTHAPARAITDVQNPQQKATPAGAWTLNAEKSDNAQDKIRDAMTPPQMSGGFEGRGGGMGGRRGDGRGGGRGRQGGAGGVIDGTERGGGMPEGPAANGMMQLMRGAARLAIELTDSTVVLRRDDIEPLTLHTDGRDLALGDGPSQVRYKAGRKDDKLVIETDIGAAFHMEETYEIKDRTRLQVDVKLTNRRLERTVKFKRVYDPATS